MARAVAEFERPKIVAKIGAGHESAVDRMEDDHGVIDAIEASTVNAVETVAQVNAVPGPGPDLVRIVKDEPIGGNLGLVMIAKRHALIEAASPFRN